MMSGPWTCKNLTPNPSLCPCLQLGHEYWSVAFAPLEYPGFSWEGVGRSPKGGPVGLCNDESLVSLGILSHEVAIVFGIDHGSDDVESGAVVCQCIGQACQMTNVRRVEGSSVMQNP